MLKCGWLKEENMKKKNPQPGSSAVCNLNWWPSQGKHGVVHWSSQGCQQTQHCCQCGNVFHGSIPPSWCDIAWSTRLLALTVQAVHDTIVGVLVCTWTIPRTVVTVHHVFKTLGHFFEVWIELGYSGSGVSGCPPNLCTWSVYKEDYICWLIYSFSRIYPMNFSVFKLEARCFNFSEAKTSFQRKDTSLLVS